MSSAFTSRPYTGSCHCGAIRYLAYIKTPTDTTAVPPPTGSAAYHEATGQVTYKCNCTTCTKLSVWHLRLADAPAEFYVLAAPPPAAGGEAEAAKAGGPVAAGGWGVYLCGPRRVNQWVFCRGCGARPFAFRGEWSLREPGEAPVEVRDAAAAAVAGRGVGGGEEKKVAIWSPKSEGWNEGRGKTSYLSINMTSVDANQPGFDMRDFTRFKWIRYYEILADTRQEADEPFDGGMF
jgi:hypothetical protein